MLGLAGFEEPPARRVPTPSPTARNTGASKAVAADIWKFWRTTDPFYKFSHSSSEVARLRSARVPSRQRRLMFSALGNDGRLFWARAMQMRRSFCAAGLLCLGLGALPVSGGCGPPTTGMRGECTGEKTQRTSCCPQQEALVAVLSGQERRDFKAKKTNTRAR